EIAVSVEVDVLDIFIDDPDLEIRRREGGQNRQAERRHDGRETPDPFDVPEAPEWWPEFRIDQQDPLRSRRHFATLLVSNGTETAIHASSTVPARAVDWPNFFDELRRLAPGQGLIGRKIDSKQVNPDDQIDRWAMTTLVNLQLKGYVRVG